MDNRPISSKIISRLVGFIVLLIFLAIANHFINDIHSQIAVQILEFLNRNIVFLFLMTIAFIIADVFWAFIFPFNLIAPIASAIASMFIVAFIYRMLNFFDGLNTTSIFGSLNVLAPLIYFLVFAGVLIGGYITVFARLVWPDKLESKEDEEHGKRIKKEKEFAHEKVTWSQVGDQFKGALYDLAKRIRRALRKK